MCRACLCEEELVVVLGDMKTITKKKWGNSLLGNQEPITGNPDSALGLKRKKKAVPRSRTSSK